MTEAAFGVYLLTLALVCASVYVCFRGIAWVVANGWRSMLGLVALRGEAVISFDDVPTDCDCEDCHWERAAIPFADRIPAEESPLLREIYAAQYLARDGVDVEKGAPREWAP